jgi:hypothetical protein
MLEVRVSFLLKRNLSNRVIWQAEEAIQLLQYLLWYPQEVKQQIEEMMKQEEKEKHHESEQAKEYTGRRWRSGLN